MKTSIRAMLVMAMIGVAVNSYAATSVQSSTTLQPSLQLTSLCSVVVADTPITAYQSTGAAHVLDVANIGTVTVNGCSADYLIGADGGANYSSGRQLKEPTLTKYIPYTLGIAKTTGTATSTPIVAASSNWGTGAMTGFPVPVAGSSALSVSASDLTDVVYTVSARFNIPVAATAPIGTYADAVTIGVQF